MADHTDETLDPSRSTSDRFNRRAFVGIAGGVAALAAAPATARADDLGKPHPPLVAEDDPALVVSRPVLTSARADGPYQVNTYAVGPKARLLQAAGIVLVMHVWGVDALMRDTARRLAKAGYRVIVPDLYSGLDTPSGDGTSDISLFRPSASKLADASVDADLTAGATWLRAQAGRDIPLGVMGFCMGGGITLRQTVDRPHLYSAASVFYGKVRYGTTDNAGAITPIALAYAEDIGSPLAGSFGGRDTSIKADDVRALDHRLAELRKPRDIKVYDEAGHAFFDDTRESYVASAATDAWARTLTWFKRYL
jgi:carboxymethylenebutenolidase